MADEKVLAEEKADGTQTKDILPPPSPGSDINFKVIVKAGIALVGITIAISVLMWFLFQYFAVQARRADPQLSPVTNDLKKIPPEPRLQISPVTDLKQTQGIDEAYLENYGWVDDKSGVVRIPIDEAKKLIVQRYKTGSVEPKTKQNANQ